MGVDALGIGSRDTLLAIVPMFHANCWGTPYACAASGAKVVYPGPFMDGDRLYELIEAEKVTVALGVPTVWLGLITYLKETGKRIDGVKRTVIGGTAIPPSMLRTLEDDYGVQVCHAWGMTETSPLGTTGVLKAGEDALPGEVRHALKLAQGRGLYGVELRIVDEAGRELARDGETSGHLMVRGPWVARGYLKGEGGEMLDSDGWFPTGDIATLSADGRMRITDRAKDVIKSGGEWISSIELENTAMGHPEVAEAAVIGLPHPKWDERPLLVVVRTPGSRLGRDEILAFLAGKVAKWWLPDEVVFADQLPHTPTGKVLKTRLREIYADTVLPTAARGES
jgi:fatty-acyl-CoA synthase